MVEFRDLDTNFFKKRDYIFTEPDYPKSFTFSPEVAEVFDDMVTRSVPLYFETLEMTLAWCQRYSQPESTIVDIGCSTGTMIDLMLRYVDKNNQYLAIDSSSAMIDKARVKLKEKSLNVQFECGDACEIALGRPSVVIANYTLQFLSVEKRRGLINKIYHSLLPGGLFFLTEKVASNHASFHKTAISIHENFKKNEGYSRTEIERKKEALDNVLIPLTYQEQIRMLESAGFEQADAVLKWNNFTSIVALKGIDGDDG